MQEDVKMPHYLIQASYANDSVAAMVKKPEDRAATVRGVIEKFGGKMHGFYYCFGDYDVAIIAEVPDNVTMAAVSMAVTSSGALKAFKTTVLMPPNDGMQAMRKASEIAAAYRPPGR